jgi:hypothetical protein
MALDRFVVWDDGRPTDEDVGLFLSNFFGGADERIDRSGRRFFVRLPGVASFPFAGLVPPQRSYSVPRPDRWIEVVLSDTSADVLTREQDEYTNALADGIAAAMERFWRGTWHNRE